MRWRWISPCRSACLGDVDVDFDDGAVCVPDDVGEAVPASDVHTDGDQPFPTGSGSERPSAVAAPGVPRAAVVLRLDRGVDVDEWV